MQSVPWGYVATVVIIVAATVAAWRPPSTNGPRPTPSFVLGSAASEVPVFFALMFTLSTVIAATSGDLVSPVAWAAVGVGCLAVLGLGAVESVAVRHRHEVEVAVDAELGTAGTQPPTLTRGERLRTVCAPIRWPSYDVEVVRNVGYGPERAHRLDVFRRRGGVTDAPVLVHLHGGGWTSGRRSREGRLLMQALARRGWLCVSADYRLAPSASFPDFLVDAKRVIAWARTEGVGYGAGSTVVACGGSAGANLAVTAALTPNDPDLQPGFEDVDTSVQAALSLYGYYGPPPGTASAPADHVHAAAPPTLLVHGDRDPMVPPAAARDLADRLRAVSTAPVVHVELTGGLHSFDRFDSVRTGGVVRGVLHFLQRTGLTA